MHATANQIAVFETILLYDAMVYWYIRIQHQVSCLCMKDVVTGFMQTSDVIFVHEG